MTGRGPTVAGGSRLRLRPIRPEDAAFLLEVYGSTRAEELDLTDWDTAARAAFVQMQFTAQHTHYTTHYPDARYEIITLDGADIGRLYVRRTDPDIVLMDIALLPAFRNRGFGSRILQTLLDEASAAGARSRFTSRPTIRARAPGTSAMASSRSAHPAFTL